MAGGPRFISGSGSFKLSTDSVLLSHLRIWYRCAAAWTWAEAPGSGRLLAEKNGSALIDAVEIQEASVEYFNMNINENGLVGRVNVISGDLRQHRRLFEAGAYDLVVSNPPYFPRGSGKPAPDESRATARDESAAA